MPIEQGGFAVGKSDTEDRFILPCEISNDCIDSSKLPEMHVPCLPQLAAVRIRRPGHVVISKADARHYFHALSASQAWRRWLAVPPIVSSEGIITRIRNCAWPMGCKPSAAFAHRLTEACCHRAGLPDDRRLVPGNVCPASFPIWGAIIDDVWVMHDSSQLPDESCKWIPNLLDQWDSVNVASHPDKLVTCSLGEIQGIEVCDDNSMGLASHKLLSLVGGTFLCVFSCFLQDISCIASWASIITITCCSPR